MLTAKGMRFPLDVIIVFCMPAQRHALGCRTGALKYRRTSPQRHVGLDQALLNARTQVYEKARQANLLRCSRQARNWSDVNTVHLNPQTPQNKELHTILEVA